MSRISTNLAGIERTLLNRMAEANAAAAMSTLRLATMKKINYASDDPAAFVTLSRFQSQLTNVVAAMDNATAASSMISQAALSLAEIQTQLAAIQGELAEDSPSQQAIDEALTRINEIAGSEVDGRRVLDGSAGFVVSGRNSGQVAQVTVYATRGGTESISGNVLTAAAQAGLHYAGSGGATTDEATIVISGSLGSETLEVESGQSLTSLRDSINALSHLTGVTASLADANHLDFTSVGYGTAARVSIEVVPDSGTFNVTGGDGQGNSFGMAATAIINGIHRTASGDDGNRFEINESGFRYEIRVQSGYTGGISPISVSGSALSFALSSDVGCRATVSIPDLHAARLGGYSGRLDQIGTGGAYSGFGANKSRAIRIVGEAVAQVTRIQGNLDGFAAASVTSAANLLADLQEDLQDSIDAIDLVNADQETARVTFYQQLANNAAAGLTVINQQRGLVVEMIRHIAGLT